MIDLFSHLWMGFSVALSPWNLLICFVGCILGTLIGVLPGIGPTATVAMLMPISFYLTPVAALIMLAGVYYGSQYAGSTTAILVNLPGEASSVVTCLDGYAMALQGRAGSALAVAALASFFAGTVTTIAIAIAGPPLARIALLFHSADYVSVMILGLVCAMVLAHGSLLKASGMIVLGIFFGLVGTDVNTGVARYTFGIPDLYDGIGFVPVAMGMFGVAEIILNLEETKGRDLITKEIKRLWPTRDDFRLAWPATVRGTLIGLGLGILPGSGATVGSFAGYSLEKKVSRDPSRFGKGAVEGVAGPEAANNAAAQANFIPMLSLGLPANALMAMMIGALMIHGITPGPMVIEKQPVLFWGLVASMWLGNLMLVIINLPLIGVWVKLLQIPYRYLFPAILLFCCIGVYSLDNSITEVAFMALFGVLGYFLKKLECEPAPLLLGLILGPMLEENFRRAMVVSGGDLTVFVTRPISLSLLVFSTLLMMAVVVPAIRRGREVAFKE